MPNIRKCPICGAEFAPETPRQKYCSISCRRAGAAIVRSQWIQKTGHREKDRLRHRERRERAKYEKNVLAQELKEKKEKEITLSTQKRREEFNQRCAEGDLTALLLREKAMNGNTTRKYWELFASVNIKAIETSGIKEDVFVNGISIFSDHFADDAHDAIHEEGVIRTKRIWSQ